MSESMVEKVARAINPRNFRIDSFSAGRTRTLLRATNLGTGFVMEAHEGETNDALWLRAQARAAIEAMKDPPQTVTNAGVKAYVEWESSHDHRSPANTVFNAMISAALTL